MAKELLLFPFGGTAREALAAILSSETLQQEWNVLGFFDDTDGAQGKVCCGVKVLGRREVLKEHKNAYVLAVPSHPDIYLKRKDVITSLGVEAGRFATIIHPSSVVAPDATVGENSFIGPHCFVSVNAGVGNHCVVLSGSVISHDSRVSDYCCLGVNVTLSGRVAIGESSYIGSAVSIRQDIRIGERSLVGIGANVISDVPAGVVVVGNPAAQIRFAGGGKGNGNGYPV